MKNINFLKLTKLMLINVAISTSLVSASSNLSSHIHDHYQNLPNDINKNDVENFTVVNDTVITQQIRSSIALNQKLSGVDVQVNTKDGIVTLSGKVISYEQNKLLLDIIESIEGVKSVNNNLQIANTETTSQYIEDASITTKIKTKLLNNNITSGLHIKVKTINNIVYLQGKVKNFIQLKNAEKIAKNTKGVKEVKNRLLIK